MTDKLLNEREVSHMLGVSVYLLQKKRRTGNFIPFTKIGSAVRYFQKDVEAYLSKQRFDNTSQYDGGETC